MDTLIAFLVDKFGWGALIFGLFLYLVVEGFLDVVTDIISHKILEKKRGRRSD